MSRPRIRVGIGRELADEERAAVVKVVQGARTCDDCVLDGLDAYVLPGAGGRPVVMVDRRHAATCPWALQEGAQAAQEAP